MTKISKNAWIPHYECPICGEIVSEIKDECPFCHMKIENQDKFNKLDYLEFCLEYLSQYIHDEKLDYILQKVVDDERQILYGGQL